MFNNFLRVVKMKYIPIFFFFITADNTFAAGNSDFPPNYYDIVGLTIIAIVAIAFIALVYFESKKEVEKKREVSLITKLDRILNRSVPIEKEEEILFEHEYDGIKELDSQVPPWYTGLFYATILFSIIYLLNFHVFNTGKLMYEEYDEEMKIASLQQAKFMNSGAFITEESVTQLNDDISILAGKEIYDVNCVACHSADGGGLVGPNFTDEYWIHGGGIKNIFKVIKYGVPDKGMIGWQTQINSLQIQQVASYIMTLKGNESLAPKAPEGEIWVEPESTTKAEDQINL